MDFSAQVKFHKPCFLINTEHFPENSRNPILTCIMDELSSPAAILQTNIQILKKFSSNTNDVMLDDVFSFCVDSIDNVLRLIENVKYLCLSENLNVSNEHHQLSVRLIVYRVLDELSRLNYDVSRVELNFNDNNYTFLFEQEQEALHKIVFNLLSNALKFSRDRVRLSFDLHKNIFSIVVFDTGVGIPQNQIQTVLNPFGRAGNVKMIPGLGLGLSIITKAVNQLQGNIYILSAIGSGSEFRIDIPINDEKSDLRYIPTFAGEIKTIQTAHNVEIFVDGHFVPDESGLSQISSTISHELRTPVAILKSNIQLLKMFRFNLDEVLTNECFCLLEGAINEIERFLNQLTNFNIAIKSKGKKTSSIFLVKQLFDSIFIELSVQGFDCNRISIRWNLINDEIILDQKQLRQIVLNILSNSLKFSNNEIRIKISDHQSQFTVKVHDTGIGIPKDEIEEVFRPFYKASNGKQFSGTGLGFTIVDILTKNIGGNVSISSIIDQGTKIIITMPYELPN